MIKKIDHLVITTSNMEECCTFYKKLGFTLVNKQTHFELYAGDFKINVHYKNHEMQPHAKHVQCGSADICFEISETVEVFRLHCLRQGLTIALDEVERCGTRGFMKSLYLCDPEGNLLEFSHYENK